MGEGKNVIQLGSLNKWEGHTHHIIALPGNSTQQVAGTGNKSDLQKCYQFQRLENCSLI